MTYLCHWSIVRFFFLSRMYVAVIDNSKKSLWRWLTRELSFLASKHLYIFFTKQICRLLSSCNLIKCKLKFCISEPQYRASVLHPQVLRNVGILCLPIWWHIHVQMALTFSRSVCATRSKVLTSSSTLLLVVTCITRNKWIVDFRWTHYCLLIVLTSFRYLTEPFNWPIKFLLCFR